MKKAIICLIVFCAFLVIGCEKKKVQKDIKLNDACSKNSEVSVEKSLSKKDVACQDCYHVVVFASQNKGRVVNPAQTHVFATWVRTNNKKIVDQVDISWMPSDEIIGEVKGKNESLFNTLLECQNRDLKYWVLKTDRSFFEAAENQRNQLSLYRALDKNSRPKAVNCIHACSDVAGHLDTGTSCGLIAGQKVACFFIYSGKAWQDDERWIVPLLFKGTSFETP